MCAAGDALLSVVWWSAELLSCSAGLCVVCGVCESGWFVVSVSTDAVIIIGTIDCCHGNGSKSTDLHV